MSTDDKVFIKENSMNLLASVSNGVGGIAECDVFVLRDWYLKNFHNTMYIFP